jgi:hypothetical protein
MVNKASDCCDYQKKLRVFVPLCENFGVSAFFSNHFINSISKQDIS